jgi:uncharacterized membrane protein YkvA (DUF1232 family)
LLANLKDRLAALKKEAYALVIAARDPRVPWYAKVFMSLVIAHTFSPIDLIPDFIPVLGVLDDLIIVPLGIALTLKMIPPQVMVDARQKVGEMIEKGEPVSRLGAVVVILIWLALLALAAGLVWRLLCPLSLFPCPLPFAYAVHRYTK